MQWVLDLALIGLLAATLFHALRLERALGVLKRDRAALEQLIDGFNASTRQAEQGISRLRDVAEGAGRQVVRHIETATILKDDLGLLMERGERLADRLDALVRTGRALTAEPPRLVLTEPEMAEMPRVRSQAERDLLRALRPGR